MLCFRLDSWKSGSSRRISSSLLPAAASSTLAGISGSPTRPPPWVLFALLIGLLLCTCKLPSSQATEPVMGPTTAPHKGRGPFAVSRLIGTANRCYIMLQLYD